MPSRSQAKIYRHTNRAFKLCGEHAEKQPALRYIKKHLEKRVKANMEYWHAHTQATINADRERTERGDATSGLVNWVQSWRPTALLENPAAAENIRALPSGAATADDTVAVARNFRSYLETDPAAAELRGPALEALGDLIERTEQETDEAATALRLEAAARDKLTEVLLESNTVLVRALQVIRSVFGPKSPEYRQFIARDTAQEEDEDDNLLFPTKDDAA